jgi:hypothetical protein
LQIRRVWYGKPHGMGAAAAADDPKERRRIGVQLVVLALLGLPALILSAVTR